MRRDVGARPASPATMLPERKNPRLTGRDYSEPGYYFVTICTRNRECIFGRIPENQLIPTPLGTIANDCWLDLPNHYPDLQLSASVVMPNHVHGLLLLPTTSFKIVVAHQFQSVSDILGGFKSAVSRKSGLSRLWQRGFHDRIVRTRQELEAIVEYIEMNPLRWIDDEHNPSRRESGSDDFVEFFRARQASPLHRVADANG